MNQTAKCHLQTRLAERAPPQRAAVRARPLQLRAAAVPQPDKLRSTRAQLAPATTRAPEGAAQMRRPARMRPPRAQATLRVQLGSSMLAVIAVMPATAATSSRARSYLRAT